MRPRQIGVTIRNTIEGTGLGTPPDQCFAFHLSCAPVSRSNYPLVLGPPGRCGLPRNRAGTPMLCLSMPGSNSSSGSMMPRLGLFTEAISDLNMLSLQTFMSAEQAQALLLANR